MEWKEVEHLPEECLDCNEENCYNCDIACKRWYLPENEELNLKRKSLLHSIKRLHQQVIEIDLHIIPFTEQQKKALQGQNKMTYDIFWDCLQVCYQNNNMEIYLDIWSKYPEYVMEFYRQTKDSPNPESLANQESSDQESIRNYASAFYRESISP